MRQKITSQTLEGAWLQTLRYIVSFGESIPDKEPFLEMSNMQISYRNAFEIDSPHYQEIFGLSVFDYMKRVYSLGGDKKTGRNYHYLIYEKDGVNQVDKIIRILQKDSLSRSAVITLGDPCVEKMPCVINVGFSLRENFLSMSVFLKSSDIVKKFIPDMVELSYIHKKVSEVLHVPRGNVTADVLCAQVYEKDLKIIEQKMLNLKANSYFKADSIIENWDKEAEEWDNSLSNPSHYVNWENGYSRFLKFMDKEISSVNKNKFIVALDSGCGTGVISDVLNKKGYKVVAIDISPKMLSFAHKKGAERQYLLANNMDIPFEDNFFNVICSRGVLVSHVGKKYVDLFLKEHNRVLKTGGLFMFDFITKFKESEKDKKKNKAYMTFNKMSDKLRSHGFEILKRSGENNNRVNAILCKKI